MAVIDHITSGHEIWVVSIQGFFFLKKKLLYVSFFSKTDIMILNPGTGKQMGIYSCYGLK